MQCTDSCAASSASDAAPSSLPKLLVHYLQKSGSAMHCMAFFFFFFGNLTDCADPMYGEAFLHFLPFLSL